MGRIRAHFKTSMDPRVRAWMDNYRGKIMWFRSALDSRRHPEVRSASALLLAKRTARSFLVQASSWPSGLVPASAGKLTCTETSGFLSSRRCIFVPGFIHDAVSLQAFPSRMSYVQRAVRCHSDSGVIEIILTLQHHMCSARTSSSSLAIPFTGRLSYTR